NCGARAGAFHSFDGLLAEIFGGWRRQVGGGKRRWTPRSSSIDHHVLLSARRHGRQGWKVSHCLHSSGKRRPGPREEGGSGSRGGSAPIPGRRAQKRRFLRGFGIVVEHILKLGDRIGNEGQIRRIRCSTKWTNGVERLITA